MALFGGIGKKLGLGSARDTFGDSLGGVVEGVGDTINEALPTLGAVAGFAVQPCCRIGLIAAPGYIPEHLQQYLARYLAVQPA